MTIIITTLYHGYYDFKCTTILQEMPQDVLEIQKIVAAAAAERTAEQPCTVI